MQVPHRYSFQIHYEDTDMAGVVYHANALRYMDRAREHLVGIARMKQLHDDGLIYLVHKAELCWRAPARFGDRLEVRTRPLRIGACTARLEQLIVNQETEELVVEGVIELVCVGSDGKPARSPADLRARFQASEAS